MGETEIEFSGDPIYIAPECLRFGRSLRDVAFAAGIFALGVIALEMLFHIRVPSTGPIFKALRNFVDFESFEALPHFRALLGFDVDVDKFEDETETAAHCELRAIIAQMLCRKAEDRPTATQSLARVERLLSEDEFECVQRMSGIDAIELESITADSASESRKLCAGRVRGGARSAVYADETTTPFDA